ncbi:uncharacterized protein LOC111280291 isoform X3 [Durio zibethinus]|uniref:Uncharacterized protein LOC111280291 isoform X3 n=1 Tax=Durio zibethinus TaxID=66656 RepID=A0A6P5X4X8_DURZI|nr:uncharacterized protein LOC111280291 isoform X3 [Durio zibethinus]
MIVRTYGRRNRGLTRTFSDSLNDDVSDSPPLSQETVPSEDIYSFPFTTQESSSFWPSSQEIDDGDYKNHITSVKTTQSNFDFDDSRNGVVRRSKKQKQTQSKKEVGYSSMPWIPPNSTLMEAQEFGEMMEHLDEVNFALDGLKKGQPVRIRRASLLSLLSICGTAQQRRLLRTHGVAKPIIDAILGLNFDDTPSNLAAVALFYILTSDGWVEQSLSSPPMEDKKDVQSLVLLSKCLKIMENAAFLSSDNQSHLLEMKGQLNSHGSRLSFTKLVIGVIKFLSVLLLPGLYLKSSSALSGTERACSNSKAMGDADKFALTADCKVDRHDVISISSSEKSSSMGQSFSAKSFNTSQNDSGPSTHCLGRSVSSSQTATTSTNDSCLLKMRIHSSLSSSCSGKFGSSYGGIPLTSNERPDGTKDGKCQLLEDSQDPFAFDEDDFVPSKWDLLSGKKKISQTKKHEKVGLRNREIHDEPQYQFTMTQQVSSNGEIGPAEFLNEEYHHSNATSGSQSADEEYCSLLSDCLLAAVKVLMNLTNDNPLGCQQIAASGALETLSMLIASHFPSFCSYLPCASEMEQTSLSLELDNQNGGPLSDPELDFLVAILGLLVNLVEKDEHNRSRLAAASVSLPNSEGLREESHMAVIPLLCAIFLANLREDDTAGEVMPWNDEDAVLQEEKEAEKMILEAYAALLLAFLSTESKSTRNAIADCLPNHSLSILVPVLERFVAFHFTLNMISPETHKAVSEVIESCRIP